MSPVTAAAQSPSQQGRGAELFRGEDWTFLGLACAIFFGGAVGLAAGYATAQLLFDLPPRTMGVRIIGCVGAVAGAASAVTWLLWPRWRSAWVDFEQSIVSLSRAATGSQPAVTVDLCDITQITAWSALSLSGGPLIVWGKLYLTARGRRFVLRLDPHDSERCYGALSGICPNAVAMSFRGEVLLPPCPDRARQGHWLGDVEQGLKRILMRQASVGLLGGAISLALVAGVIVLIVLARDTEQVGQAAVVAVVAAIVALVLPISSIRNMLLGRRAMQALSDLARQVARGAELLDGPIRVQEAEAGPRKTGPAGRILTVLGLALCLIPVIGLLLAVTGLILVRGSAGWRRAGLVGVGVSGAVTAVIILVAVLE